MEAALDRAAEVERKMYRESLQNNREQILLSKQLATIHTDVPVEWDLAALRAQAPDTSRSQSRSTKSWNFSVCSKIFRPKTIAPRAITRFSIEAARIPHGSTTRPAEAPLAVALDLTNFFIGLSYQTGDGRAVPSQLASRRSCRVLESPDDSESRARRESFLHRSRTTRHYAAEPRDDVMLYAFLLNADPGGCSPEVTCRDASSIAS